MPPKWLSRRSLWIVLTFKPGDRVYLQWNDDLPGTLLVIPVEIVSEWIRLGRQPIWW
jgi:hypothetical protein